MFAVNTRDYSVSVKFTFSHAFHRSLLIIFNSKPQYFINSKFSIWVNPTLGHAKLTPNDVSTERTGADQWRERSGLCYKYTIHVRSFQVQRIESAVAATTIYMVKKRLRKVHGVSLSEMHMCVHKQWTMGHYLNAVLRKTRHIYTTVPRCSSKISAAAKWNRSPSMLSPILPPWPAPKADQRDFPV